MSINNNADGVVLGNQRKTVGDPNPIYDSIKGIYKRNRACLSGERYVKGLDANVHADNILIPFSPSMSDSQYQWYKNEAEYPGVVEQYARDYCWRITT